MYVISDLFKSYLKSPGREFDVKVVVNDTTTFDKSSIVEFDIEESVINSDEFVLGAVVSSRLNLSLKTIAQIPQNAKIQPCLRMNGASGYTDWLPLKTFYVDSRVSEDGAWRFVCYDKLILAQKSYTTSLLFPTAMQNVLNEIAIVYLGVEVSSTLIIDPSYVVKVKPEGFTFRDVLSFIGISHASAIKINKDGKLDFVYFAVRTVRDTITPSDYINCKTTNPQKNYTKLAANYGSDIEESTIGEGEVDNTLFFYNPFLTEDMLTKLFTALNGFNYMPISMDWKGKPNLEVGDFIKIKQRDGTFIDTIMLTNKFSFKGGLKETTTAPSLSAQESEYGFGGNIAQTISVIERRIGAYVLTTNSSMMRVANTAQVKMVLPITALSDTSIEFTITLIGQATADTVLSMDIRRESSTLGSVYKYALRAGWNTVHLTFLAKDIPRFAENLRLFMKVDTGTFDVGSQQGQFYAYGANLLSDSGIPYAAGEDLLELLSDIGDSATINSTLPKTATASDQIELLDISDTVTIILT